MLDVALSTNDVGGTTGKIPERDTTKVRLLLEVADEVLELNGGDVSGAGSAGAGGKTDVDLGLLALGAAGDNALPLIVVELVPADVSVVDSIAAWVVVKLNEEGVESSLLDEVLHDKVGVVGGALRGTGDDDARLENSKSVDEGDPGRVV